MVNIGGQLLIGPTAPAAAGHAARKDYVDLNAATVVSSSSAVTSPAVGQVIYDLSIEMFRRWVGFWVDLVPGYGGALSTSSRHEFEYNSTGQSVATNTSVTINWNGANVPCDDVTVSTGGTTGTTAVANGKFVFNRGGLWNLSIFGISGTPAALSNVICTRLVDGSANVFMGSGSRTCQSDSGPVRLVAGQDLYVVHTQQTGSAATYGGFWKGAFLRG